MPIYIGNKLTDTISFIKKYIYTLRSFRKMIETTRRSDKMPEPQNRYTKPKQHKLIQFFQFNQKAKKST